MGAIETNPLESRLVRYEQLVPCRNAFIDTRTPGSAQKENFTVIGPGVAENPEQHIHIKIPHGFNIGAARQPPGCVNSQHSHETAEVFVVHTGRWAFHLGANADEGTIELAAGDTISIPTRVFRGFTNVGEDTGFLFAVLGGDDPGNVTWAPYVFEQAKTHGLVLLKSGRLIDTTKGEVIPHGAETMPPTTQGDVDALRQMTAAEIAECVVRQEELLTQEVMPFGIQTNVHEAPIIGPENPSESIAAGRMSWNHGFHVRRLRIGAGATTPLFVREEEEVLMIQSGSLQLTAGRQRVSLGSGDIITLPIGELRQYGNSGTTDAIAYVVRGGDKPAGNLGVRGAA